MGGERWSEPSERGDEVEHLRRLKRRLVIAVDHCENVRNGGIADQLSPYHAKRFPLIKESKLPRYFVPQPLAHTFNASSALRPASQPN